MISTTGWRFQPFFIFHNLWNVILPIDELILYIFFKMLIAPPTRWIPSGKLSQKTMENHHFQWVNPLKKPGTLSVGEIHPFEKRTSQASASIAQVHAGHLLDGTEVVIKAPASSWERHGYGCCLDYSYNM